MWKHIESFIHRNRQALDTDTPDPALWTRIESQLPRPQSDGLLFWKIAASILFLAGLGYLFTLIHASQPTWHMRASIVNPLEARYTDREWDSIQAVFVPELQALQAEAARYDGTAADSLQAEVAPIEAALRDLEANIRRIGPRQEKVDNWIRAQEARRDLYLHALPTLGAQSPAHATP
ncbi:MAG: hypothetical protein OHK0039_15250 [Bacteroidia bacterium]